MRVCVHIYTYTHTNHMGFHWSWLFLNHISLTKLLRHVHFHCNNSQPGISHAHIGLYQLVSVKSFFFFFLNRETLRFIYPKDTTDLLTHFRQTAALTWNIREPDTSKHINRKNSLGQIIIKAIHSDNLRM